MVADMNFDGVTDVVIGGTKFWHPKGLGGEERVRARESQGVRQSERERESSAYPNGSRGGRELERESQAGCRLLLSPSVRSVRFRAARSEARIPCGPSSHNGQRRGSSARHRAPGRFALRPAANLRFACLFVRTAIARVAGPSPPGFRALDGLRRRHPGRRRQRELEEFVAAVPRVRRPVTCVLRSSWRALSRDTT